MSIMSIMSEHYELTLCYAMLCYAMSYVTLRYMGAESGGTGEASPCPKLCWDVPPPEGLVTFYVLF